jgi:hypothetical protein
MNTTPVDAFRNAVFEVFATAVGEAAQRVAASTDTDRVVVVVDAACDSGRNFVWSMNHGEWMDEWHEEGGGMWRGIIPRPRLLVFLDISWPSVTGTRAALNLPAPAGTVWAWLLANNGSQLRQIEAAEGEPHGMESRRPPENTEGYTFDDAANRRVFMQNNMSTAVESLRGSKIVDAVVLVLSLADEVGGRIARELLGDVAAGYTVEDARRDDFYTAVAVAFERPAAAELLATFAPEAAAIMGKPHPEPGTHYAVCVAFGGTTLAALPRKPAEGVR